MCIYSINVAHIILSDIRPMRAGPLWGCFWAANRIGQIQKFHFSLKKKHEKQFPDTALSIPVWWQALGRWLVLISHHDVMQPRGLYNILSGFDMIDRWCLMYYTIVLHVISCAHDRPQRAIIALLLCFGLLFAHPSAGFSISPAQLLPPVIVRTLGHDHPLSLCFHRFVCVPTSLTSPGTESEKWDNALLGREHDLFTHPLP